MELFSHYTDYQRQLYPKIVNWKNHFVGDRLCYSYRDTVYERKNYPSELHYHDYYELVIFEAGDISYVCDGCIYRPEIGDVILIPPGKFHMSVINCDKTHYIRHVFYLYPSAFDMLGHGELTDILRSTEKGKLLAFCGSEERGQLSASMYRLKEIYTKTPSPLDEALGLSYIIQAFYLLNQSGCQSKDEVSCLPKKLLEIQRYIDENFAQIESVSQIAEHFFYSREYVSRLFKKHFNMSISDYLTKRRIEKSRAFIMQGVPMIEVAYSVGFGSPSAFIRAFHSVMNMTPTEYKKLQRGM